MIGKSKLIGPLAVALLAGTVMAAPALAQHHQGGNMGGHAMGAAPSGGSSMHSSGGNFRSSAMPSSRGPSSGQFSQNNWSGPSTGNSRNWSSRNTGTSRQFSQNNWSGHNGNWQGGSSHRHGHHGHHNHGGSFAFGWGGPYAYDYDYYGGPYAAYYDDDWSNCYVKRVRYHHRWVLRRYCS